MYKLKALVLMAMSSTVLVACGGGSDSSGSSPSPQETIYELSFRHLPNCQVDEATKTIILKPLNGISTRVSEECKVKIAALNGGLTFSLQSIGVLPSGRLMVRFKGESKYMDQLNAMLATDVPYTVVFRP
ncbi:MAG: hypothetical protein Q4G13_07405 [Moraxella sp.]|nr:hypothetical protein [Moraxella sp.]